MFLNSHLPAHIQYRTDGTARQAASANVLSKRDKQAIDLDPVAFWKFLLQRRHGLLRRGGGNISPAVGNPVNVDVHADERFPTGDPQDKMRTLWSDTGKGLQHLFLTRKLAAIFIDNSPGQL